MKLLLIIIFTIPSVLCARDIRINDHYYVKEWIDDISISTSAKGRDYDLYNVSMGEVDFDVYIGQAPNVSVENGSASLLFSEAFPIFLTVYEAEGVSVVSISRVYAYGHPALETSDEEAYFYEYITAHFTAESKMVRSREDSVVYFLRHVVRGKCAQSME